jgi:hydroxypyruvate isomerase
MSHSLSRRNALKTLAGAALAIAAAPGRAAEDDAAPVTGGSSVPQSVCRWCYQKIPLDQLAVAAKAMGLASIELLEPEEWPIVQKHGLTCAMAKGQMPIKNGFNRLENHEKYVGPLIERIRACSAAGLPNLIVFSGNRAGMSDEQGLENCVVGVKQLMAEAEARKVTICMELLNSKVNHKDYMCDHSAWGVELVKRVGSERFKLLYDIYHMQIMEGDVIRTIQAHHECFAHFHTGGVPGRHEFEPQDAQELYYPGIVRAIKATGFKGFIAHEFVPKRDPLSSLAAAVKLCAV